MISLRFKLDSPHFGYFLRGHAGLKLREDVENKHYVRIELPVDDDELFIDGDSPNCESAKSDLIQGWYEDDFAKALELTDLYETMPHREFFHVPVKLVSSLIGHYGRRIANLEARSQASIKIDCTGHVSVYGTEQEYCRRARSEVEGWVRRELGDRTWNAQVDDNQNFIPQEIVTTTDGPCLLTFLVPARAAALIIGRKGQNVSEFEKLYRCMIDLRTGEETKEGMVPVDVTTKQVDSAKEAKDGILRFLDRYFPNRDWPTKIEIKGTPSTGTSHVKGQHCGGTTLAMNKGGVQRITFSVAEEHAPRLIGTRGLNKKRLEERTNCVLILRTEERRNGMFPVDVIARSIEECENAQGRILAFLEERPPGHHPRRQSWNSRSMPTAVHDDDDDGKSLKSVDSPPAANEFDRETKLSEDSHDEESFVGSGDNKPSSTPMAYSDNDPFMTDISVGSASDRLDSIFGTGIPSDSMMTNDLDFGTNKSCKPLCFEATVKHGLPAMPIGTHSDDVMEIVDSGLDSSEPELEMNSKFLERLALLAIEEEDEMPSGSRVSGPITVRPLRGGKRYSDQRFV